MRIPIFLSRNYGTDDTLELLFSKVIKGTIVSIESNDDFYNTITFYNGSIIKYWKRNHPYASWYNGTIITKIGDTKIKYDWSYNVPSKKLLNRLLRKIDDFIANDN